MANQYSQLYIQLVITVKRRQNLLHKAWRAELFQYMSKIITHKGHQSIIVNGVEDHVHLFVGLNPSKSISDLVRDIKNNSSNFINKKTMAKGEI